MIGMKISWATLDLTARAATRAPSSGWSPTTTPSARSTTISTGQHSPRYSYSYSWPLYVWYGIGTIPYLIVQSALTNVGTVPLQ